ncbi:unnamed protein product [Paramecium primaurelia]|uniref:Uncharacterized protein n=1 Tax=Paramecium primaurelia TaxID=5886 RepID=A0A8S1JLU0_PARPR|nr:unnamed protein product [Paramecium primaurelia]
MGHDKNCYQKINEKSRVEQSEQETNELLKEFQDNSKDS